SGDTQGFTTILAGPEHPPYGLFCPAAGHQLGFNDLKVIEVAGFLQAIATDTQAYPNFTDAVGFERVIHAMALSANTETRVTL
ncbi:MAG TPA: gfo/Idh/MocA family oxidoreductase, partial [Roseibacterium sp.]|nr:gfo/Idh/MocA family oxidoreductase [Roseibacterium sp.]